MNIKKVFITAFVSVMAFVSVVSFTACGKGGDKKTDVEEKPEYVYEADFKEVGNIKMDSLSRSCFNNGKIYMASTDIEYGKDYQVKSSKNYLLQCSADSDKTGQTEISGLKDNEYVHNLFLDNENSLCIITSVQNYNRKTNQDKSQYYMMRVDETGKTSGRIEIKPDKKDNESFYLSNNTIFLDGKLIVYFDKKVYTFNKDGSADKTFEFDNYIDGMFTANNGKV